MKNYGNAAVSLATTNKTKSYDKYGGPKNKVVQDEHLRLNITRKQLRQQDRPSQP